MLPIIKNAISWISSKLSPEVLQSHPILSYYLQGIVLSFVIYLFYLENVSRKVALSIKNDILSSTRQLENQPDSGQVELHLDNLSETYRYILSGNYKIIYKSNNDHIFIFYYYFIHTTKGVELRT